MLTIYKYPLVLSESAYAELPIELPQRATFLHMAPSATAHGAMGAIDTWWHVNTDFASELRVFVVTGTGWEDPLTPRAHLIDVYAGTVVMPDGPVWHVWERLHR